MAWFLNHYACDRCHRRWSSDWPCMCDDDCPHCGSRHYSPSHSDDLTEFIETEGDVFIVLRSSDAAEHGPDYEEIGRFPTRALAEAFLESSDQT